MFDFEEFELALAAIARELESPAAAFTGNVVEQERKFEEVRRRIVRRHVSKKLVKKIASFAPPMSLIIQDLDFRLIRLRREEIRRYRRSLGRFSVRPSALSGLQARPGKAFQEKVFSSVTQ